MIYITVIDGVVEVYSDTENQVTVFDVDMNSEDEPIKVIVKSPHWIRNLLLDLKQGTNTPLHFMRQMIRSAYIDAGEAMPLHLRNLLDVDL